MVLSMGTTNTLYLPHRINIAVRFNFNTIFYVQCRSEEISPPKRVKRGHLLSDYRQKRVNASRDILMSKARKMTILTITMFYDNVHTGCLFLTGTS